MPFLMLSLVALSLLPAAVSSAPASSKPSIPQMKTQSIEVLVHARKVKFPDQKPKIENEQVLVPLRFVSDKLGGKLDLKGNEITIVKGDRTVKLVIGAQSATVNGKTIALGVPAQAVNGRTYVPLRFISEALGEKVEWDKVNRFVWIGSKDVPKLEDVVEAVDLKPYLKYFKGGKIVDLILDNDGYSEVFTKARIIKEEDFPLVIAKDIYYRVDYALVDGKEFTRAITTDKGVMGRSFYLLQAEQPLKYRGEASYLRESIGDIRIHYNLVVSSDDVIEHGIKNYSDLKLKDVEYIGIHAPSDAVILVENYLDK